MGVAALSLLMPWSLAFDPQAWVVWGREAAHLALDTRPGPAWKPLPVLVTAPLTAAGEAAPALWMLLARSGALLALAGAAALGTRIGGRWAGVAAAAVLALSPWWGYNALLGNSEGLLAAAVLWAIVAHMSGYRGVAVALGTAAALMRPEVWPFLALYGAWLWPREPALRRGLVAAGVVVPALWLGPDVLGIGGALGASEAARGQPSPGSAGLDAYPGLSVLGDAAAFLTVPALLAAVAAVLLPGAGAPRVLAAGAAAWVALVAVMAQAGYAGNPRYLAAAAAVGCALAGAGAVRLGRAMRLGGAAGATVLVAAVALVTAGELRRQADEVGVRASRRAELPVLIAAAGGPGALTHCARVRTAQDVRPLVAWELGVPMAAIDLAPLEHAVVLRWRPHYPGPVEPALGPQQGDFHLLARAPGWAAWAACG